MAHRGIAPDDTRLFGPSALATLRVAADELAWLLGRGYALTAALALVGNHHQLEARQRTALQRSCCSDAQRADRSARVLAPDDARGVAVQIDGFNLLVTLEVALGGGLTLLGRDCVLRDLAGMRGSYHVAPETPAAVDLVGAALADLGVARAEFYFDAAVSNSGRLRGLVEAHAAAWPVVTTAALVPDPDAVLKGRDGVVTADAAVLDRCGTWLNLAARVVRERVPAAWVVDVAG